MIKFENTGVFNFEGAIRGMRNPLNSWDMSDSFLCERDFDDCAKCKYDLSNCPYDDDLPHYVVGANDLALMKKLVAAGSDHRKFLRQIFVSVDITAPLYWWKEFDTYKVGTVANSCSTMHKIHDKEFTLDDFSCEHLGCFCKTSLEFLISDLNRARDKFVETEDKYWWWQMIQLLPNSYNQRRTVTLNYEVLRNIRNSDRRYHKLDEWRVGFMDWIDSLPYAKELIKF